MVLALGLVAAAVVVTLRSTSDAAAPEVDEAVVDSARDGDTITLRDGAGSDSSRSTHRSSGAGEYHARAALEALRSLAPAGVTVRLETDPALEPSDRFGRALRYVLRGAVDVNLELGAAVRRRTTSAASAALRGSAPRRCSGGASRPAWPLGTVSGDRARPGAPGRHGP